jgi:hypothetical protein
LVFIHQVFLLGLFPLTGLVFQAALHPCELAFQGAALAFGVEEFALVVSEFCVPLLEHAVESLDLFGGHGDFALLLFEFGSQVRILLYLLGELRDVQAQVFDFSVSGLVGLFHPFQLHLILALFRLKSALQFPQLPFGTSPAIVLIGVLDLVHLLDPGPLQRLELRLPCVDLRKRLIEAILEFGVILVHALNLFERLVVLGLHVGVHLRNTPLLCVFQFNSLFLQELPHLVVVLLESVAFKGPFRQFLDLYFIAVAIQIASFEFFEPELSGKYLRR